MKTKLGIWSLLLVLFVLFSCKEELLESNKSKHFFDLKAFVKSQAELLSKQGMPVIKKVAKGGKSEQVTLSKLNWEQELNLIAESDLNRPSWKNHYDIDTARSDDSYVVTYTGQNKDLAVKRIVLTFRNSDHAFMALTIEKSSENFLYTSWQKIYYTEGGQLNIYGNLNMHDWINNSYSTELTVVNTSEIQ